MRKLLSEILITTLLLTGCSSSSSQNAVETKYQGYYEAIEDVAKVQESSLYYDMRFEMTQVDDGTYRYYIFIDHPQCGMFDMVAMAVEKDMPYSESTKMAPCIGIYGDRVYNMIPNQVYAEKGYVEGIVLSGETDQAEIDLKTLVEWHDKTRENDYREYGSYHLTVDGVTFNGNKKDIVQTAEEANQQSDEGSKDVEKVE